MLLSGFGGFIDLFWVKEHIEVFNLYLRRLMVYLVNLTIFVIFSHERLGGPLPRTPCLASRGVFHFAPDVSDTAFPWQ